MFGELLAKFDHAFRSNSPRIMRAHIQRIVSERPPNLEMLLSHPVGLTWPTGRSPGPREYSIQNSLALLAYVVLLCPLRIFPSELLLRYRPSWGEGCGIAFSC